MLRKKVSELIVKNSQYKKQNEAYAYQQASLQAQVD